MSGDLPSLNERGVQRARPVRTFATAELGVSVTLVQRLWWLCAIRVRDRRLKLRLMQRAFPVGAGKLIEQLRRREQFLSNLNAAQVSLEKCIALLPDEDARVRGSLIFCQQLVQICQTLRPPRHNCGCILQRLVPQDGGEDRPSKAGKSNVEDDR